MCYCIADAGLFYLFAKTVKTHQTEEYIRPTGEGWLEKT